MVRSAAAPITADGTMVAVVGAMNVVTIGVIAIVMVIVPRKVAAIAVDAVMRPSGPSIIELDIASGHVIAHLGVVQITTITWAAHRSLLVSD